MLPPDEDGLILDNHYQIVEKVPVGIRGQTLNMHEFHFVEDGRTLLLMKRNITHASKEMSETVGFDGECSVVFDGFEELDTTGERIYPAELAAIARRVWTESGPLQSEL